MLSELSPVTFPLGKMQEELRKTPPFGRKKSQALVTSSCHSRKVFDMGKMCWSEHTLW